MRDRFNVVLAGGSTPERLYRLLAKTPRRQQVAWDRLEIFWSDERAAPPEHPASNFGMARRALLQQVAIPAEQIHRMQTEHPDLDAAARAYERRIVATFGLTEASAPPSFDLILLGMGADGHTASLFPGTRALTERRRWVVPGRAPRSVALERSRLTMTPRILNQARHLWFLITGADKAAMLAEVLGGLYDPMRLPVQLIRPSFTEALWMVDEAAATQLGC